MAAHGDIFDGYRLIRPIGRGGFGEVWLCRLEATGELRALKFLPAHDPAQLERELAALIRYRSVAAELQCPNLLPIEHVNRSEAGLFYTMPLADGTSDSAADDPDWQPWTLATLITHRKEAPTWFGVEEIRDIILPLVAAVQRLSDAGAVHRDIKPENILFLGGRPCLGDISLLTEDSAMLTRRGTPGYVAPSWYLESGGSPDMWGLATTLYSLLTGNAPDKIGRAKFLWPPQGEASVKQETWNHFHRVILRAASEQATERFLRFEALAQAISGEHSDSQPLPKPSNRRLALIAGAGLALVACWYGASHFGSPAKNEHNSAQTSPLPVAKQQEVSPLGSIVALPSPSADSLPDPFTPQEVAGIYSNYFDALDYQVLGKKPESAVSLNDFRLLEAQIPSSFWNGKPDMAKELVEEVFRRDPSAKNDQKIGILYWKLVAQRSYGLDEQQLRRDQQTALANLDRIINESGAPEAFLAKAEAQSFNPMETLATLRAGAERHPHDARFMINAAKLLWQRNLHSRHRAAWSDFIQRALELSSKDNSLHEMIVARIGKWGTPGDSGSNTRKECLEEYLRNVMTVRYVVPESEQAAVIEEALPVFEDEQKIQDILRKHAAGWELRNNPGTSGAQGASTRKGLSIERYARSRQWEPLPR